MAESQLTVAIRAKDEASNIIKGLQSKFSGSFGAMTTAVSALTGVAGGLFAYLSVDQFAEVGGAVADMAARTGLAAESISALRVAAQEGGTSIETVEGAIKKMQMQLTPTEDGFWDLAHSMKEFGVVMYEDFASMTGAEQFETLAQQIGAIEDPATRTQAAIAAFGKSGSDLLPMMADGSFSMEEWTKKAQELGVAFDDEAAAKADALGDAMDDMKIAMSGVQLQIASALAPVVTDLANKLTPLIGKFTELVQNNPQIILAIGAVVTGLVGLGMVIGPITAGVGALSTAFIFLAANPIVLVIAAVVALVAAISYLIANWDLIGPKVAAVWESVWGTVTSFTGMILETIVGWVDAFLGFISSLWEGVKAAFTEGAYIVIGIIDFLTTMLLGVSLPTLVSGFIMGWTILKDAVVGLVTGMAETLALIWEGIKFVAGLLFEAILAIFQFYTDPLIAAWKFIWDSLTGAFNSVSEAIKSPVSALFDWITEKFEAVKSIVSGIGSAISSAAGAISSAGKSVSSKISGKRALGGPVASGNAYLVGENGPEIFQPYTGGNIVPNNRSGGIGGVNVSISVGNVSNDVDIRELGRVVGDQIMRTLKQNQLLGA